MDRRNERSQRYGDTLSKTEVADHYEDEAYGVAGPPDSTLIACGPAFIFHPSSRLHAVTSYTVVYMENRSLRTSSGHTYETAEALAYELSENGGCESIHIHELRGS